MFFWRCECQDVHLQFAIINNGSYKKVSFAVGCLWKQHAKVKSYTPHLGVLWSLFMPFRFKGLQAGKYDWISRFWIYRVATVSFPAVVFGYSHAWPFISERTEGERTATIWWHFGSSLIALFFIPDHRPYQNKPTSIINLPACPRLPRIAFRLCNRRKVYYRRYLSQTWDHLYQPWMIVEVLHQLNRLVFPMDRTNAVLSLIWFYLHAHIIWLFQTRIL